METPQNRVCNKSPEPSGSTSNGKQDGEYEWVSEPQSRMKHGTSMNTSGRWHLEMRHSKIRSGSWRQTVDDELKEELIKGMYHQHIQGTTVIRGNPKRQQHQEWGAQENRDPQTKRLTPTDSRQLPCRTLQAWEHWRYCADPSNSQPFGRGSRFQEHTHTHTPSRPLPT